jgi:hypothetical protein
MNMRNDERHLVEVPRKQLSRLSYLVVALRRDPEKLQEYEGFDEFASACLDVERNGVNSGFSELCIAIGDLIMNAVYPA